MKNFIITCLFIAFSFKHYSAQSISCDSLIITEITISQNPNIIDYFIYNGNSNFLSYPHVSFTIGSNGDTLHNGNINLFGAFNLDTTVYSYDLGTIVNVENSYPLSVYFVYYDVDLGMDTCVLKYPNSLSKEIQKNIFISLYPNPTKHQINIEIENYNDQIITEVYDLIGNLILSTKEKVLNLENCSNGIYLFRISFANRVEQIKVIKE